MNFNFVTIITYIGILLLVLALLVVVAVFGHRLLADGPSGPILGAEFKTGNILPYPEDQVAALSGDFEFELSGFSTSRTAGGIPLGDKVYLSCDLGFVWARFPSGLMRNMLHTIWIFKDWHIKAQEDGRVRIRKDGNVYEAMLVLEQDPEVIEALKSTIEGLATEAMLPLAPRTDKHPNDILFFEIVQR